MQKTPEQRIKAISKHFLAIMQELDIDLNDDSVKDTPNRVAKMYVNEICAGLFTEPPKMTVFENKFPNNKIVLEEKIWFASVCEHHWLPIVGECHIGYIPDKWVLGLSKFHRAVHYFASRPQIQERLTDNIGQFIIDTLKTKNVMVVVKAKHFCCHVRGVRDYTSATSTSFPSGIFMDNADARMEFFKLIEL